MSFVILLGGLIIGYIIGHWKQREINDQLKGVLDSFSERSDIRAEFSIASLIRRELSNLKEEKQDLIEQIQTLQDLLQSAPVGYLQVDADNHLIWCNQQARELLSIDRWQPNQSRLLLELVRSSDLDRLIEKTRSKKESQTKKWIFYPGYYSSSLEDTYGQKVSLKATSYSLANSDIGVFLENQDSIAQAYKRWERSISDLAHELRTPLTSIELLAQALSENTGSKQKKWSQLILGQTNRLINLIETWLDITQLQENSQQQLNFLNIELHSLIDRAWHELTPIAQLQSVNLQYQGLEQIHLKADEARLMQVFTNLFHNALKHSPTQTSLQVDVSFLEDSQFVVINIIDMGKGFSENDLPHIFERLYRGDSSRSRSSPEYAKGSGLGLSIVQQIINAHQGSIKAFNHPVTKGAWLQITLPLNPT
jgi:two-component system phosphate regulon sensor histidine kinase PhoR